MLLYTAKAYLRLTLVNTRWPLPGLIPPDCRWYQGGGCAHPEAAAKPQRRRRANK